MNEIGRKIKKNQGKTADVTKKMTQITPFYGT